MGGRIAVAGAGVTGLAAVGLAQASPACRLAAVVDPSAAAVQVAAAAHVPLYPSLGALLAKERPDGVILATPNRLHVPQALECLAAAVPVLIEKPIATSVAEGERLLAAMDCKARV